MDLAFSLAWWMVFPLLLALEVGLESYFVSFVSIDQITMVLFINAPTIESLRLWLALLRSFG